MLVALCYMFGIVTIFSFAILLAVEENRKQLCFIKLESHDFSSHESF